MARAGAQAPSPPPGDALIVATAAAAVDAAAPIQRIWPGFWSPPSFAIYRRDTVVYLFTTDSAPGSFMSVASDGLPPSLHGRFYVHTGAWRGLRGGVLPIDPNASSLAMAVSVAERPSSLLEFLLHESFHGFQVRQFADFFSDVPQSLPETLSLPASYGASLPRERQLLIAALRAPDDTGARAHTLAYLEARGLRLAEAPPLAGAVERTQERIEGTAEYVGLAGVLSIGKADATTAARALRDSLAHRLTEDWRWGDGLAMRPYVSGAAAAALLDLFECGGWREAVQAGRFLDAELAACLGP